MRRYGATPIEAARAVLEEPQPGVRIRRTIALPDPPDARFLGRYRVPRTDVPLGVRLVDVAGDAWDRITLVNRPGWMRLLALGALIAFVAFAIVVALTAVGINWMMRPA